MTRFDCPECGNGKLKPEEGGGWRCNGMADPGHADLPLEACEYWVEKLPTLVSDVDPVLAPVISRIEKIINEKGQPQASEAGVTK